MFYISFALIVRDDHSYIREWIEYHHLLGVEHFYINDNQSVPPLSSVIQDYIDSGLVTYTYDPRERPQVKFYNECIAKYQDASKWIAFFDSDEFLVLKKHLTIQNFLKDYEEFGSLSIAWVLFGSNGHREKQSTMLESYTSRCPETYYAYYKCVIQPLRVKSFVIHNVNEHHSPYFSVDEQKRKTTGPLAINPSIELCQLNHYIVRSTEDYAEKRKRGGATRPTASAETDMAERQISNSGAIKSQRTWKFFDDLNFQAKIHDQLIFQRISEMTNPQNISRYSILNQQLQKYSASMSSISLGPLSPNSHHYGLRLAIFLHLFEPTLWFYYRPYIKLLYQSGHSIDFYLSYQNEHLLHQMIRDEYPNIRMLQVDRGCDLGGQLMMTKMALESGILYDFVLKLHSKTHDQWREGLVEPLCGSSSQISYVLDLLRDQSKTGIIGAQTYKYKMDHNNSPLQDQMCQRLKLKVDYDSHFFIGGTIFWFRWSTMVKSLSSFAIDLTAEYNQMEQGFLNNYNPTIVHSWERIIALLIQNMGYDIHGVDLKFVVDYNFYRNFYPDLRHLNDRCLNHHYNNHGRLEKRICNPEMKDIRSEQMKVIPILKKEVSAKRIALLFSLSSSEFLREVHPWVNKLFDYYYSTGTQIDVHLLISKYYTDEHWNYFTTDQTQLSKLSSLEKDFSDFRYVRGYCSLLRNFYYNFYSSDPRWNFCNYFAGVHFLIQNIPQYDSIVAMTPDAVDILPVLNAKRNVYFFPGYPYNASASEKRLIKKGFFSDIDQIITVGKFWEYKLSKYHHNILSLKMINEKSLLTKAPKKKDSERIIGVYLEEETLSSFYTHLFLKLSRKGYEILVFGPRIKGDQLRLVYDWGGNNFLEELYPRVKIIPTPTIVSRREIYAKIDLMIGFSFGCLSFGIEEGLNYGLMVYDIIGNIDLPLDAKKFSSDLNEDEIIGVIDQHFV